MTQSTENRDKEAKRDALIMGGLYSAFGFLGMFLVATQEHFMNLPSSFGSTPRDPFVTAGEILVIGVSIFMFWFATHVYKNTLKHNREMNKIWHGDNIQ